jgi:membrane protein implicated in regulation of membrane protease activity
MPTWLKYFVLQIPGWAISAVVLASLWYWQWLSSSLALIGFFTWMLKDLILYRFVRHAYEDDNKFGSATLVGARGVAQGDLNPHGFVRVRGELWRATAVPESEMVAAGTAVEIVDAERMELFVRPINNK